MASKKNGTLTIGATNDLRRRVWQHKNDVHEGFSKMYCVNLAWYDPTNDIQGAIQHEKRLKKWNRQWKINLIEKENLKWTEIYEELG